MKVKQLLLSGNFWVLNKDTVLTFGAEPALMLTVLAEAENLFDSEWFYQTSETIVELTTLSKRKQTSIIEKLKKMGVLDQENRGMPCKRYFRLDYEKIEDLLNKTMQQQEVTKCNNKKLQNVTTNSDKNALNKESSNKESNNKKYNIKDTLSVSDSESKNILPDGITYEWILEEWNKIAENKNIPSKRKINPADKNKIKSRCKIYSKADWIQMFKSIRESKYLGVSDENHSWFNLTYVVRNDSTFENVMNMWMEWKVPKSKKGETNEEKNQPTAEEINDMKELCKKNGWDYDRLNREGRFFK